MISSRRPYVDETLQAKVQEAVDRQERDLARVCAEKSMVLLKNEAVLPLAGTDLKRLTLKPGETQEVTFELTPATLGYVDREGRPQTDAGDYRIWLAPNSRDLGKGVVYTFRPE